MYLRKQGPGTVDRGRHRPAGGGSRCTNPDLQIATPERQGQASSWELTVERGRGYVLGQPEQDR